MKAKPQAARLFAAPLLSWRSLMNAQRILLTFGAVYLLVATCGGLYLGPQVNPTRDAKQSHFVKALEHLSARESETALAELKQGMKIEGDFRHLASLHSHVACMAFAALLIGLVQPFFGLSEKGKVAVAWMLVAGSVIHDAGVLIELVNLLVGAVLAGGGALLIIISVIAYCVGILKYAQPVK